MGSSKKKKKNNTIRQPPTPYIGSHCRNLKKNQLGAVIFGCKHHTFTECLLKQMFGLPASHFHYVKNISPGLTLFLFNYSNRTLHGIYEAKTPGQMNIDPYGWITSEGTESTPYPAQVRVDVRKQCRELREEEFKHIIANNYYADKHFWFELDKEQTTRLTNLFLSPPLPRKIPRSPNVPSRNRIVDKARSELYKAMEHNEKTIPVQEKKWSSLFRTSDHASSSDAGTKEYDSTVPNNWEELEDDDEEEMDEGSCSDAVSKDPNDETNSAQGKKWSALFGTSDQASSSQEIVKPHPESCPDVVTKEYDSTVPDNWEELEDNNAEETDEESYSDAVSEEYEELEDNDPEETDKDELERDTDDLYFTDVPSSEDGNFWDSVAVAKEAKKSLDLKHCERGNDQSTLGKLMGEIERLKASQLTQSLKIDSLEHELAHLKKWVKLESIPPYSEDHFEEGNRASHGLKTDEFVLIVGGYDGSAWLPSLDSYSPSENNVTSLCQMTFLRSFAAVAKLQGKLYLLGGANDGIWYNTVESYNPMSNQWVQCPPLNQKKGSLAGASLNDKIYAIGGGDGVDCFSFVELFDINHGKWIFTQPMIEKRFAPAATDMNGALYVAGGYNGKNYSRSVERFDPRESAWTSLSNMNTNRGCHSLVGFKEKIYALGGYDGSKMVSTVEVFDPRVDKWMIEEPMSVSRGYFGSFVFEGKLYAIGGVNGAETLDTIECYEEGSGWRTMGRSSIGKRCYFSSLTF